MAQVIGASSVIEVSLNVHDHPVPFDIEGTPAARVIGAVHPDGVDPVLIADSPHNDKVPRPKIPATRHFEFAGSDGNIIVRDNLFRLLLRYHTCSTANENKGALIAASSTRSAGITGPARAGSDKNRAGVAHPLSPEHHSTRINFHRHGHAVIARSEKHGAAETSRVQRTRRHLVDRRLDVLGVVPGDRPDCLPNGHGRDRNAATTVSSVRRVDDGVSKFIRHVDELIVGAWINSGCGRGQVLGLAGKKHGRQRDLQNRASSQWHLRCPPVDGDGDYRKQLPLDNRDTMTGWRDSLETNELV